PWSSDIAGGAERALRRTARLVDSRVRLAAKVGPNELARRRAGWRQRQPAQPQAPRRRGPELQGGAEERDGSAPRAHRSWTGSMGRREVVSGCPAAERLLLDSHPGVAGASVAGR